MEIQPPGSEVPDPFFAAVRRRHPDVDIVLLPPEAAPADGQDVELSDDDVATALGVLAASRDDVEAAATLVWRAVLGGRPSPSRLTFRPAVDPAVVRAVAEGALALPDDQGHPDPLPAVAAALTDVGWQVERATSGLPRLIAHQTDRGALRVAVSYAEQTRVVRGRVDGAECRVGRAAATELIRADGGRHTS